MTLYNLAESLILEVASRDTIMDCMNGKRIAEVYYDDNEDPDPMDIADQGLLDASTEDFPGMPEDYYTGFGYCWMHHFKCHSARSCDTWAGGGPIDENEESLEWQEKAGM